MQVVMSEQGPCSTEALTKDENNSSQSHDSEEPCQPERSQYRNRDECQVQQMMPKERSFVDSQPEFGSVFDSERSPHEVVSNPEGKRNTATKMGHQGYYKDWQPKHG